MHFWKFSYLALTLLVRKILECCEYVCCEELQELIFMITINFPSWMRRENQVRQESGLASADRLLYFDPFWQNENDEENLGSRRLMAGSMMVASMRGGAVTGSIQYICLHSPPSPLTHSHMLPRYLYLEEQPASCQLSLKYFLLPGLRSAWDLLHVGPTWTMLRISWWYRHHLTSTENPQH